MKLKEILFEMPHVEYPGGDLVDFQFEKYNIPPELKRELLKAFNSTGVVAYSKQKAMWMYISNERFDIASEDEINKLPVLPPEWEEIMFKVD